MSKAKFTVGDKVKIPDGHKIEHYIGGWAGLFMSTFVGKNATVRSSNYVPECGWYYCLDIPRPYQNLKWDERGLELVGAKEKIVIYREGRSVFARNLLTGKIAEAKCNPEDQFNFRTGAKLAFDRLMGREEKKPEEPKPEPEKPLNMKVVCVEVGTGMFGAAPLWWTLGKVYNVVDGIIRDDDGDMRASVHSLDELNKNMGHWAKFIEYKGAALNAPLPLED